MPRDDLSIDFVKKMPQAEPLDPGLILDDWINRVQNLPEEIRFMQEEIADKDRQYSECIRMIEDRDGKIQKWIKSNGSHEPNPKEELLRTQVREFYARADQLSQDKIALAQRLQANMDKHLRSLDVQIKLLYDRAEPGFTDPDEVPSLLRPSAANHAAPPIRFVNLPPNVTTASVSASAASPATTSTSSALAAVPASAAAAAAAVAAAPSPLNPAHSSSHPATTTRLPAHPNVRHAQAQQNQHAASAPATPAAASIILNRQRENSAGPTAKRVVPRANTGPGNAPAASSGLARHSSLGPGTPKSAPSAAAGAAVRAGSAGPRASSVKAATGPGSRRGTPTATGRKKTANKSSLSRVKKASARNSPASTVDSDLSEAESISADEDDGADGPTRSTLAAADGKDADGDDVMGDAEDDEDAGDDRKYCLCHNVSYGDMVACDNDNCPYEWFHWSCVGLKSEPNGTWYCPVCAEKFQKKSK